MPTTAEQLHATLVEPAIRNYLHDRGFTLGDFWGQKPLTDVIRDESFNRDLNKAMFGAAQADRPTYEKLMRGFATLGGVPWTGKLQELSQDLSGHIAEFAPYIMRWAPDIWDQLHGSSGSVASMTQAIAEAN